MSSPSISVLDSILSLQLAVAWAGEGGDEPRLNWWRTDLASEFGGIDLFKQLLPSTWQWATLEAAREAARRTDHALRLRDHAPDRLLSLFRLGFAVDERLDQRLDDLKRSGRLPEVALPELGHIIGPLEGANAWDTQKFSAWLKAKATPETVTTPTGRRLKGAIPPAVDAQARQLAAALLPLTERYPVPHFVREA